MPGKYLQEETRRRGDFAFKQSCLMAYNLQEEPCGAAEAAVPRRPRTCQEEPGGLGVRPRPGDLCIYSGRQSCLG